MLCADFRSKAKRVTARSEGEGGLVLVDKEQGPSSFAVVRRVCERFRLRAGHSGTLDPLATGLLVCLVGRSTRLARYLVGLDKRYVTEIRLGLRTTTGDGEGDVLERTAIPTKGDIAALEGEVALRVPQASAVKIGGERAYRLARRGVAVEMPLRRSTVYELELLDYADARARLELTERAESTLREERDRVRQELGAERERREQAERERDELAARLEALTETPQAPETAAEEPERVRGGYGLSGGHEAPELVA